MVNVSTKRIEFNKFINDMVVLVQTPKRLTDKLMKQCWSLMFKDFKDDDQSTSSIVRFSSLVVPIPRLTIFTSSLRFYLKKKTLGVLMMKIKNRLGSFI